MNVWDDEGVKQEQWLSGVSDSTWKYLLIPVYRYSIATGTDFLNRTHTRMTYGPKTMGIPVPVWNPNYGNYDKPQAYIHVCLRQTSSISWSAVLSFLVLLFIFAWIFLSYM